MKKDGIIFGDYGICPVCDKEDIFCYCLKNFDNKPFTDDWFPIDKAPKDGERILVCNAKCYNPTTASYRTYHPNAEGKMTWRDAQGIKLTGLTHFQKLPLKPNE